jgi:hypothetical protein
MKRTVTVLGLTCGVIVGGYVQRFTRTDELWAIEWLFKCRVNYLAFFLWCVGEDESEPVNCGS